MPGFMAQRRLVTPGKGAERRTALEHPSEVRHGPVTAGRAGSSSTRQSPWGAPMRPGSAGWSLPLIPADPATLSRIEELPPAARRH